MRVIVLFQVAAICGSALSSCATPGLDRVEAVRFVNDHATQIVRFDGFYRAQLRTGRDQVLRFYPEGYVLVSDAPRSVTDARIAHGWLDIRGNFGGGIARSFTIRGDHISFNADVEDGRNKYWGIVLPDAIVLRVQSFTGYQAVERYLFRPARFHDNPRRPNQSLELTAGRCLESL